MGCFYFPGRVVSPMMTIPRYPSTVTRVPLGIREVASGIPVTQGIPYSRAMIAPWISMPPRRSTMPGGQGNDEGHVRLDGVADQDLSGLKSE